ncbi:hypothetical protein Taro_055555 [Colocasia esculenta]|uniref:Ankyrin repeat domain-containing protein, chloroplastic n=1 Tax=Colocasia esculenta TaxID=4460 RepID=A0A843XTS3_COLES|nr:hypothetical protein [Colocasia esculenta]
MLETPSSRLPKPPPAIAALSLSLSTVGRLRGEASRPARPMLLPLPPPPPPPACSLRRPVPPFHLLSAAAAPAATPLLPARLLRSCASPIRAQLHSSSSTPDSLPFSFSFTASSPGDFRRNPNPAGNGEYEAEEEEESIVGDCLVFEEGAFEGGDPFLPPDPGADGEGQRKRRKPQRRKPDAEVNAEDLVPEKWREVVAEINLTKKEKRRIAQELKFGSRVERRKKLPVPDLEEYRSYRAMKLSQLNPVVLDNPRKFPPPPPPVEVDPPSDGRVSPRNPRIAVGDASLEAISDFLNSDEYVPGENDDDKKPGKRKLFTKEEKVLLNKQIPNLADATSSKWLPLHTLAASGEFYLLDTLLKHTMDVNVADKDGLCAIHKAILGNKVAIVNYLLKESANPFVCDQDGATLLHYAVVTASSPIIKILLLYDVDINLPDDVWL